VLPLVPGGEALARRVEEVTEGSVEPNGAAERVPAAAAPGGPGSPGGATGPVPPAGG
jgi:hypothetical protein